MKSTVTIWFRGKPPTRSWELMAIRTLCTDICDQKEDAGGFVYKDCKQLTKKTFLVQLKTEVWYLVNELKRIQTALQSQRTALDAATAKNGLQS
jgi:hypothetical protein